MWVCCPGSTRRLNREVDFCCCFWRSPGSNLRPLVYKESVLTRAPRIFAVLVNDVNKFYYNFLCMVKFINLRFVNYYLFFRKFIKLHVLNIIIK